MRGGQQQKRARARAIAAGSVWLGLFAATAAAQDAERGRCAPEIEARLEACQSGAQDVWHYTYQGRNDARMQRSWPYKSRERAERAMEADRKLCETVDRYFDHTDCQTRYGEVFCGACETRDAGLDWLRADTKRSLLAEVEYWDRTIRQAARSVVKIENGRPAPGPRFGNVFREYVGQLKAARQRVRAIEALLGHTTRETDELTRMIATLDAEIRTAESSGRQIEALSVPDAGASAGSPPAGPESRVAALTAQCTRGLPTWTPVCDQAVDALFAAAKTASPSELVCLKEWRAYHNCIGIYAHDSNPNPRPSCTPPACRPQ